MQEQVDTILQEFRKEIEQVTTAQDVHALKVRYLGRKGPIQLLMKGLKDISAEERPEYGKRINILKKDVEETCQERLEVLEAEEMTARLEEEKIDVTAPGRRRFLGRKHVVTQMIDKVLDVMRSMGFSVQYGPDIETDYYNFEALNFEQDHPARDMQDTFYLAPDVLLRTHTSNVQVRVMETSHPPIRIAAPGRCFRNETISVRSHVFFHQVEALYVDEDVTFTDLYSAMTTFVSRVFDVEARVRFRPSYFPFVEPGMEVDAFCFNCKGVGCPLCKYTGWLEVAGAGMVHPNVLKSGGIDPEKYTGYAWGLGIERLVMLKYGIDDIRLFTENDMRFLEQFS